MSFPKEFYMFAGICMVILIVVALVSLFTNKGYFSKFMSIFVMLGSVAALVFGHAQYKREHTLVGKATELGRKAMSLFGL